MPFARRLFHTCPMAYFFGSTSGIKREIWSIVCTGNHTDGVQPSALYINETIGRILLYKCACGCGIKEDAFGLPSQDKSVLWRRLYVTVKDYNFIYYSKTFDNLCLN